MQKVIIMKITRGGELHVESFTNYRETEKTITPVSYDKQKVRKSELEHVQSLRGLYEFELISRKLSYAEMKSILIKESMQSQLFRIEYAQKALVELSKLL